MFALDQQLVELATRIALALGNPTIIDFHHPTASDPRSLKGDFCVVRLAGGGSGLSYTLAEDFNFDKSAIAMPSAGDTTLEWIECFAAPIDSVPGPQRSAALATINALYNALLRHTNTILPSSGNSFGLSEVHKGEKIGMVGFFPPLVKQLRKLEVDLTVVELRRDLEREHPGLRVTTDRSYLAQCNKVLCTSTTLLNQTLPAMVAAAPTAKEFAILGPSAGCPPEPIFALGVHTLASAQINDDDKLWHRLVSGEKLGDARHKCNLSAHTAPTTEQLLATLETQR